MLARLDTADATAAVDAARDNVDSAADALDTAEDAADAAAASPPDGGTSGGATSSRGATGGGAPAGGSGSGRAAADAVFSAQQRLNNAELTLATAERTLAGTTVRAPAAGRILSVSGAVGSEVSAGGAFIVLAGRGDVAVTASFSEAAVVKLALGQVTAVTLADRGDPVPGSVSQIDPVGTVSSRLVTYGGADRVRHGAGGPPARPVGHRDGHHGLGGGALYVASTAVSGVTNGDAGRSPSGPDGAGRGRGRWGRAARVTSTPRSTQGSPKVTSRASCRAHRRLAGGSQRSLRSAG